MSINWVLSPEEVFNAGPVVPVLVVNEVDKAVPLAHALMEGGIKVLEVTLRTPAALAVIETIAKEVPEAFIGAGTVTNSDELKAVTEAGAKFAISPGLTSNLLKAGASGSIPLIPGVSSISDLMTAAEHGYNFLKFFPAEAAGGVKAIKSIGGPFPNVTFCPTGGISPDNYLTYLALKNVRCVGGSWLAPDSALEANDWAQVTALAKAAVEGSKTI